MELESWERNSAPVRSIGGDKGDHEGDEKNGNEHGGITIGTG